MITKAIRVAAQYHEGQFDKVGKPYILHPIKVYEYLEDPTEDEAITAILHDVVEDTLCTFEILRLLGFSEEVIEAVDAITRQKSETYIEYLVRCCKNEIATKVKFADVKHNFERSINYPDNIPEEVKKELNSLKGRYEKSLRFIQGEDYA